MVCYCFSQIDEIFLDTDRQKTDSADARLLLSPEEVDEYVHAQPHKQDEWIIGGFVSSIFHESIDSAKILFKLDNKETDSVFTHNGLFSIVKAFKGSVIDLSISHPDFHSFDTSILLTGSKTIIIPCSLEPKYKILLRGRVFAGNMPLEGVDVEIRHEGELSRMKTRGCFYDIEDYWNCLYDGMFKFDIATDNPDDSVHIFLSMNGMKPLNYGLIISEYQGEIMELKMKYESSLPKVPMNGLNLKLGFPFLSVQSDWYVGLSYYRLINRTNLRRIAYGIDGCMYVSAISVSHNTFPGLDKSVANSLYLNGFIGPSLLFWMIRPEKRMLSSYAGLTCAINLSNSELTFQPFIGTRIFIDMNKAISLELRYTEFNTDIVHYTFNPYGDAYSYLTNEKLMKLHANLGIQIAF